ncbi:MAG: type III secretion system chaperone [Planctomycetota bacterium]|jgi:hypothetical protein|nr:type III secretion system chaperone [Planctomycetota bacterium]
MHFTEILKKVVKELGMPTAGINDETTAAELVFEGTPPVAVELVAETECVVIGALFCNYPDRERLGNLLEFLMNAHAYGQYTHGAFFSANSERCQIVFHRVLQIGDLTEDRLSLELARFLEALKYWKEMMDSGQLLAASSGASPSRAPIFPGGGIRA